MSLGLAISGVKDPQGGEKLWTLETISWWDERELIQDPRFVPLDLGPEKVVYEAVMKAEEALALSDKFKKKYLEAFSGDPLSAAYQERRVQQVQELEDKLNDSRTPYTCLWVFEWDF